jgi:hypothetical protein
MILVGMLHLKFLQRIDMALINVLESGLRKCCILTLTGTPFMQGTVDLIMSAIFSNSTICMYKRKNEQLWPRAQP